MGGATELPGDEDMPQDREGDSRDHNPAKQLGLACWLFDVAQASYMNECVD